MQLNQMSSHLMASQDDFLRAKAERIKQRYGQKPPDTDVQKPELTDEEKELVNDLKNELCKYICIGSGPSESLPPLEENPVVKRFAASGLRLQAPPKPVPKTHVNYDKLIDEIVAEIPHKLTMIGNIDPICPYCNAVFPKRPKAKTKCKNCGNYVYVRARPFDNERVLIREMQGRDIEIQKIIKRGGYSAHIAGLKHRLKRGQEQGHDTWKCDACPDGSLCPPEALQYHGRIVKRGTPDEVAVLRALCIPGCFGGLDWHYEFNYGSENSKEAVSNQSSDSKFNLEELLQSQSPESLQRYRRILSTGYNEKKIELKKNKPRDPPVRDIHWHLLTDEALKTAFQGDMGLHREVLMFEAGFVLEEGRKKHALTLLLELCYLDMNGPVNARSSGGKRFDPTKRGLSPGILDLIKLINSELHLEKDDVRTIFLEYARFQQAPMPPLQAWEIFEKYLHSEKIF